MENWPSKIWLWIRYVEINSRAFCNMNIGGYACSDTCSRAKFCHPDGSFRRFFVVLDLFTRR